MPYRQKYSEIEVVKKLAEDLKLINQKNNWKKPLQSAFYSIIKKRHDVVHKDQLFNYREKGGPQALQMIMSQLYEVLHKNGNPNPFWPMIFDQDKKTISCIEMDIIQVIGLLNLPLDFQFETPTRTPRQDAPIIKVKTIADVLETLCGRVDCFLKQCNPNNLPNEAFNHMINILNNFDLSASPALNKSASMLTQTLFFLALRNCHSWNTATLIHLLNQNAKHGLKIDGSFSPCYTWPRVQVILNTISNAISCGAFTLDASSAKELFQVYAAFFDKKSEFPASLYQEMQKFIPQFQQDSFGSSFEKIIQKILMNRYGVLNYLQNKFDIKLKADVKNPIIPEIGLEADILISHTATDSHLAIQVDGNNYHSFPWFDPTKQKTDNRTAFRDFCFKNAGYPTLRIWSHNNHSEILSNGIQEKLIDPVKKTLSECEQDKSLVQQKTAFLNQFKHRKMDAASELYSDCIEMADTQEDFDSLVVDAQKYLEKMEARISNHKQPELDSVLKNSLSLRKIC